MAKKVKAETGKANRQNLYLVDASIYIFRSWFSMPDSITDKNGDAINAVYGYLLFVSKFLKAARPGYPKPKQIALAFDESLDSCFRNDIYPLYKSSRGLPDDNLEHQLKLCRKLTESLGLACFSSKRYEADDLIGSLAEQYRSDSSRVIILSKDKDLGQLLKGKDQLWDFAEDEYLDAKSFGAKFGVKPNQFVDYLALLGDPVDDIPGVKGIGAKAAQVLIQHFSSLEKLYERLSQVVDMEIRGAKRIRRLLEEGADHAFMSQQLAQIHCGLKPAHSLASLTWQGVDHARFERALKRYGIQGRSFTALSNAFIGLEAL